MSNHLTSHHITPVSLSVGQAAASPTTRQQNQPTTTPSQATTHTHTHTHTAITQTDKQNKTQRSSLDPHDRQHPTTSHRITHGHSHDVPCARGGEASRSITIIPKHQTTNAHRQTRKTKQWCQTTRPTVPNKLATTNQHKSHATCRCARGGEASHTHHHHHSTYI
jgi:hypothetical protein